MPEKRKFGKWIVLGSILIALLIMAFLAHLYLNVMPEKAIERELAKIRARGEPVTLEELAPPEIPDAENAALVYEQAFGLYYEPPEEEERKLSEISGKDLANWSEEDAKIMREYIEKNEDCLRLIHQAAMKQKCRFDLDYNLESIMQFPLFRYFPKIRESTRLLRREALYKAKQGKINEALESCRAGLCIGKALPSIPFLIPQLVRYATDGLIFSCLQEILNENDAEAEILNRLLKELDIEKSRAAFTRCLQGERCLQIDLFEALIRDSARLWEMIQIGGGAAPPSLVRRTGNRILLRLARPFFRRDEIFGLSIMRRMIDLSKLPYHKAKADLDKLEQDLRKARFYCMFTKMSVPALIRSRLQEARHEAKIGLAQLALALKIYKAEKGRYPDTLAELVPEILPQLPQDPFTGRDFVYKREAEGFLLYSLGENAIDEGGKWDEEYRYEHDIPWRCKR